MNSNGRYHIYRKILRNGIEIKLGKKIFPIHYPQNIWQEFPEIYRQNFADTLSYFLTRHLSFLDSHEIVYHFPPPATEPFFFKGMVYSLPETVLTDSHKVTMTGLLKSLYNSGFRVHFTERPRYARFQNVNRNCFNRAIIPFSFGKDSLLTFALTDELGIKPYPVFFREPKSPYENRHKTKLSERFWDEFEADVNFFPLTTGRLRQTEDLFWGWDLLLTQYTLLLMPYLFGLRARFLFWAHEASCNETFIDNEGFIVNPVYEQSYNWLLLSNSMAKMLGCNAMFVSLLEPIHEIAIMKILHFRYPEVAKYQLSCFADEEQSKTRRWCGVCSKCARMYVFMMALGVAPKTVGFTENMLDRSKKNLFALFEDKKSPHDSAYGQSRAARDEQLLAFTMAYKRGVKGELIKEFQKHYLKEGKAREEELRSKYFGIHTTETLPYELKKPILNIYEEELKELR